MREGFSRRPVWWLAYALALGIAMGLGDWALAGILSAPAWPLVLQGLWSRPRDWPVREWPVLAVLAAASLSGGILGYSALARIAYDPLELAGTPVTLEGRVAGVVHGTGGVDLFIRAHPFRVPVHVPLAVDTFAGREILPGDYIRLSGQLERPRAARNPFGFDARRYWYGRGVGFQLRGARIEALAPAPGMGFSISRALVRWRRQAMEHVLRGLSETPAALVAALVLGDSRALPPELSQAFRASGTIHLMAVSGLHVGMVAGLAGAVVARLLPRQPWRWLAMAATIGIYAVLAGARPPVLRSAVSASLSMVGLATGRFVDGLNLTGAAAVALLVYNPLLLWDLSFQFSFLAVTGILVLSGKICSLIKIPAASRRAAPYLELAARGIAIGLAAQLALLPLLGHAFGTVSWWGPVATLPLVPLITIILLASLLWLAVEAGLGVPSLILRGAVEAACRLVQGVAQHLDGLTGAAAMPGLPGWWVALYYVLLFGILGDWRGPLELRRQSDPRGQGAGLLVRALAGAAVLWLAAWPALQPRGLELVFLDVGQGDAIVIGAPGGRWALVDAGLDGRAVTDFLRSRGTGPLTWIVATHEHADHQGGIPRVLEEVGAAAVVVSYHHGELPDWSQLPSRPQLVRTGSGDTLPLTAVEALVLAPGLGDALPSVNDRSIVLMLSWSGWRILLTGDTERAGEEILLRRHGDAGALAAHILKVGHHGSDTSSTPAFLAAVQPRVAVIQVGRGNVYGHPHQSVVDRLEQGGTIVKRTDRDGAIWIRLRGSRMEITSYTPDGPRRQVITQPEEHSEWLRKLALWMRSKLWRN